MVEMTVKQAMPFLKKQFSSQQLLTEFVGKDALVPF